MTVLLDTEVHAVAIKTAIDAQLGQWHTYDYDEVPGGNGNPGTLPRIYVLLTVSRMSGGAGRMFGGPTTTGFRITTRAVAPTVSSVRWALNRVSVALNEQPLSIGGFLTTPVQFETDTPIADDDGVQSGLISWAYTI